MEDCGDQEEGQCGPSEVDRHVVVFERERVRLRGRIRPVGRDAVDFDQIGIFVTIESGHVLPPPRQVGSNKNHRRVRRKAQQVQEPDPLGCR